MEDEKENLEKKPTLEQDDSNQELFAAVQNFSNQVDLMKEINLNVDASDETDISSTQSFPFKEQNKMFFFVFFLSNFIK